MKPDKRVFWILKTPGGEFLEYSTEPMNYDWSCCSKLKLVPATELQRVQKLLDEAVEVLKEASEWADCDDVNGEAGNIAKDFLSKLQSESE